MQKNLLFKNVIKFFFLSLISLNDTQHAPSSYSIGLFQSHVYLGGIRWTVDLCMCYTGTEKHCLSAWKYTFF